VILEVDGFFMNESVARPEKQKILSRRGISNLVYLKNEH